MENSQRWTKFFTGRKRNFSGIRYRHNNKQNHYDNNDNRNYKRFWSIALLMLCPIKPVFANTTVASPQSNSTGVVNNNATMITPSSLPQNRYSQGIVCTSPSLTITPYLTDSWSFALPRESVTYQKIYDEDTGEVKYIQETPRFEKDNFNLNYGISLQFNIPLGNGGELCKEAAKVNIEAQKLLIQKTRLEMSLYRLEVCGKQAKLGVVLVGDYAVTCEGIEVIVQPNQVLPHTHEIPKK